MPPTTPTPIAAFTALAAATPAAALPTKLLAAPQPLLSPFGLRLVAVALFSVDMLGLPEDPCFGECVPNGDFGLLEAVFECFGLL